LVRGASPGAGETSPKAPRPISSLQTFWGLTPKHSEPSHPLLSAFGGCHSAKTYVILVQESNESGFGSKFPVLAEILPSKVFCGLGVAKTFLEQFGGSVGPLAATGGQYDAPKHVCHAQKHLISMGVNPQTPHHYPSHLSPSSSSTPPSPALPGPPQPSPLILALPGYFPRLGTVIPSTRDGFFTPGKVQLCCLALTAISPPWTQLLGRYSSAAWL